MRLVSRPVIPIVDLFAGPGGLGEGFSAFSAKDHKPFRVVLSIEKDEVAHRTLRLRSFFRQFPATKVPSAYYDYLRGDITAHELAASCPDAWKKASSEAWHAELGNEQIASAKLVDRRIRAALGDAREWLLIGGPPCQAYSLVGRARMRGIDRAKFEADRRHFLYREYLRIIAKHKPAAFVMENVKGLLSSTISDYSMFERITQDLRRPSTAFGNRSEHLEYKLYSFVAPLRASLASREASHPTDYIIRCEQHEIPQSRHRVVIFGVRSDLDAEPGFLRGGAALVPTRAVIGDLPPIRSMLSRTPDSIRSWREAVERQVKPLLRSQRLDDDLRTAMGQALSEIRLAELTAGDEFMPCSPAPKCHAEWYVDPRLGGVCNHAGRGHLESDLGRYFFAACYASSPNGHSRSPTLADFPPRLLPAHKNIDRALTGSLFADRFRVQLWNRPSTTVTAHISKDGHYYIHPDATQCRSLTVREAARLQTFPDNYFFEGPRTTQYQQVGNAVPPILARGLAAVVFDCLSEARLL